MLLGRSIVTALIVLGFAGSFAPTIDAQTLSADEKALAAYKLTMPNVKKAMAAVQSLAEEAAKDPKVQEQHKLKKQIETLQQKDELTDAEQAQMDKLQERLEALEREAEGKEDDSPFSKAQTIDSMEAAMKKHPAGAAALAKAGISAREYALTLMALLQAALIEGMSQGKVDLKTLPPGVNADNILFVREHKAEIEAMQKAMEKK